MSTKIQLTQEDKNVLEELTGSQIYLRNSFEFNQKEIGELLEQGRQNALVYLERNKLGQKLSMFEENNLFVTIVELQKQLGLPVIPRRIECYDISHLSGKFVYGSMITFVDGRPSKKFYRLFKCPDQNNDFENHRLVLTRRLKRHIDNPKNDGWALPDLIVVDGGKGQLDADYQALLSLGLESKLAMVSLAKKEEEVFLIDHNQVLIKLPNAKLGSQGGILLDGQTKFLIQRIRDEAHRFAITNNRAARLKTATKSELDSIPGVGPKTKIKLLQTFGSAQAVAQALYDNRELVYELVGNSVTAKLKIHFGILQ